MHIKRLFSIAAVLGFTLLLGFSPAAAAGEVELIQLLSPRAAREFLETVEWKRYQATQINIAESEAWEDKAIYLDLKDDGWAVEFPNDRFISLDRQFFGDIANPRPVNGDVRTAALMLLDRDLVYVYRLKAAGGDTTDTAIVLTPYTVYVSTFGKTIRVRLDEHAMETREGDLTGLQD